MVFILKKAHVDCVDIERSFVKTKVIAFDDNWQSYIFFLLFLWIFGCHLENENIRYLFIFGSQLEKQNIKIICRCPFGETKYLAFVLIFVFIWKSKTFWFY